MEYLGQLFHVDKDVLATKKHQLGERSWCELIRRVASSNGNKIDNQSLQYYLSKDITGKFEKKMTIEL